MKLPSISSLINRGTQYHESERIKSYLVSLNSFLLLLLVEMFIVLLSEIVLGNPFGVLFAFLPFTLVLALYVANGYGHMNTSSLLFCTLLPLIIFMISIYYEGVDNTILFFLIFSLLSIVFRQTFYGSIVVSLFNIALYLGSVLFIKHFGYISSFSFHPISNFVLTFTFLISSCMICFILIGKSRMREKKINTLIDQLNEKNHLLEKSNAKLALFSQMASHDLKVPLKGLDSYLNLIQKNVANEKLNEVPKYIKIVKKSVSRMSAMIEDTLEFSTVDSANRDKKYFEEIDLGIIAKNIRVSLLANEENIKIEIDELPRVFGRKNQVYKVFQNLIENGIKYNRSTKKRIRISCISENGVAHISIKDNGIGIKADQFNSIFQPYKRLHSDDEFSGSGLGLAICKDIVESMEGSIDLKSNEEGSTFMIRLPIAKKTNYLKSEVVQGLGLKRYLTET